MFKEYFKKRKSQRIQEQFKKGFEYYMSAYYIEEKSMQDIEVPLRIFFLHGNFEETCAFDSGANKARRLIKYIENNPS